jgi:hypothetical protein
LTNINPGIERTNPMIARLLCAAIGALVGVVGGYLVRSQLDAGAAPTPECWSALLGRRLKKTQAAPALPSSDGDHTND